MEIILKQDVENLGFKDDTVEVKKRFWPKFFNPPGTCCFSNYFCKKSISRDLKATCF